MDTNQVISTILFILLMFLFIYLSVIKVRKVKKGTALFKVVIYLLLTALILAELIAISVFFISIPIVGSILYPVGLTTFSLGTSMVIKNIQKQEQIIKNKNSELVELIKNSRKISVSVSNNATELAASANEINVSSEEIADTTQIVAQKTMDHSKALDKVIDMTQNISNITGVITNIANQTNLLALNASIEAGRAGEHGKGFSVVAEKVQQLSVNSKSSVEKTNAILKSIVDNIKELAREFKEVLSILEGINANTEEQTASMQQITANAVDVTEPIEKIKGTIITI